MKLSLWIRRRLKKFKLKSYSFISTSAMINPNHKRNEHDVICGAICRKLINNPDSKFTIAPISEKRYIINKPLGLFVVMMDNKIEITNHIYHYNITLTQRESDKLRKLFDRKVESIREDYENEIKSQINNTLQKIFDKVMEC